jgi:hypothetical protein
MAAQDVPGKIALGKIAVITANFGGIDTPKPFPGQLGAPAYDYYEITERNAPQVVPGLNYRLQGKFYKLQGHIIFPGYDALIWIDGNVEIKSPTFVADMLRALEIPHSYDIAIPRHPVRNCIYEEAEFISSAIAAGNKYLAVRYDAGAIRKEAAAYRASGHPPGWGLYWCGLFAKKMNPRVNFFFDQWWDRCLHHQSHDQNSFPYLARELDLKIAPVDLGDFYENATYRLVPHLKIQ